MGKYGKKHKRRKEGRVRDAEIEEVKKDHGPKKDAVQDPEQKEKSNDIEANTEPKTKIETSADTETNNDVTDSEAMVETSDALVDKNAEKKEKKLFQNLVSLIILLGGLFVGSILVDVVQLATGQGFSQKAINNADVFEVNDRTWVAYDEPIVDLIVLTDGSCEECEPDQALVFLRRYLPTLFAKNLDVSSDQGARMAEEYNIKTIPAFVFEGSVEDSAFYLQAQPLFEKQGEQFVLNTAQLGLPVGKYLELPNIDDSSISVGSKEAPIVIVEFSDFQCPFCQAMHPSIMQAINEFGEENIRFVHKHLPLGFHEQAENAALASECAYEQEKFMAYADLLYDKQDAWGQSQGTALFKQYARQIGLSSQQFNQCLDSKKYQEKLDADMAEAQEFGLTGTPSTFINGEFLGGAADYETVQAIISNQLQGNISKEMNNGNGLEY